MDNKYNKVLENIENKTGYKIELFDELCKEVIPSDVSFLGV